MIYTVFPKDEQYLPQDFPTYAQAYEYAEELKHELGCDYDIQETTGEVV